MNILDLKEELGKCLGYIAAHFKPGAKITLVVRNPDYGDAGVVIGNDDLGEAIKEIRLRMKGESI